MLIFVCALSQVESFGSACSGSQGLDKKLSLNGFGAEDVLKLTFDVVAMCEPAAFDVRSFCTLNDHPGTLNLKVFQGTRETRIYVGEINLYWSSEKPLIEAEPSSDASFTVDIWANMEEAIVMNSDTMFTTTTDKYTKDFLERLSTWINHDNNYDMRVPEEEGGSAFVKMLILK